MRILRCHIRAFGQLRDLRLDFAEGLTLIFAANEGGKSTLERFIIALLYGQLRADLRVQRRLDAWVDSYKPWQSTEYGGTVWCRLSTGQEVEVRRAFGKDEDSVEIRAATGEAIDQQYERLRNGDLLFAQHHLGIPKELFESIAVIKEGKAGELEGREMLRDRIANLAQSGNEETSVRRCLSRLEETLDSVGSERAPTKPLKQALDRLHSLEAERDALQSRRAEFQDWLAERSRLGDAIQSLERDAQKAAAVVHAARWREAQCKVLALEEIDAEIRRLNDDLLAVGGNPAFPIELLDELQQLEWAREELQSRLGETRSAKASALSHLGTLGPERRKLELYAVPAATTDTDQITEWFVSWLSLSRRCDDAQQAAAALEQEIESLEEALRRMPPAAIYADPDWQRLSLEASDQERMTSEQLMALTDKIAAESNRLAAENRRRARRLSLGLAAAAAAISPSLLAERLWDSPGPLGSAGIAWITCWLAIALFLWTVAWRSHRQSRQLRSSIKVLEADQARLRATPNTARVMLSQAVSESGFKTVEELLTASRQVSEMRQRIHDLDPRLGRFQAERQATHSDALRIYALLKETLGRVGLPCAPASLREQVDTFRSNMRKFRELETAHREGRQRLESLEEEEARLSGGIREKEAGIQSVLEHAGVTSTEQFRNECLKSRRMIELQDKMSSLTRELLRLSGGRTLDQCREDLKEMGKPPDPGWRLAEDGRFPLLPCVPSLSDAELEARQVGDALASAREEHARVSERVSQAFRNYRTPAEVEEDLVLAERLAQQHQLNRKALQVAQATIAELSRLLREATAPRLNQAVGSRFLRICRDRYVEVKIDPDFQVWIREASSGDLRKVEKLSRGTQDQLYFALRFGVLELLAGTEETCPCMLDEPFAAYDRVRIEDAFRILEEESRRRQVFLFTCREDIRDLAQAHQARIIELTT